MVVAGGSLSVTGDVLDDALVVGGSVTLLGMVGDDLRVAGGQVQVNSLVGGDFVGAGGSINILPDAVIEGDLVVAGGEVILDGVVNGDVRLVGGRLVLNGTVMGDVKARLDEDLVVGTGAVVMGELSYKARKEGIISEFAQIGSVVFEPRLDAIVKDGDVGKKAAGVFALIAAFIASWRFLMLLGFTLLVVLAWKKWANQVVETASNSFLRSFGLGLVMFIVTPVIIALLLMSLVGTLVGLFGIAAYAAVLILSKVFAAVLAGAILARLLSRRKAWQITWPWAIFGVVALKIVGLVPILGWLAGVVLMLAALGILMRQIMDMLHVRI
jgi:cytoskeletal protein CcmA (bactofilin family)